MTKRKRKCNAGRRGWGFPEYRNYEYENYMSSQPMRDGEEMRNFFDDDEEESEEKK